MREPGRSLLLLGPSGSGKSHTLRTALKAEGSGVVVMALGLDEIESYRDLYPDADIMATPEDVERLIQEDDDGVAFLATDKPYLFAAFDDEEFFPSLKEWTVSGQKSIITFLRLVRKRVQSEIAAGNDNPYAVLGVDSYSGVGELASNAMLSYLKSPEPPKARGDGGATYYIGYANKLSEVARACRSIRGYGSHWIATCHVQVKEASDTFSAQDVTASEQEMPMFTGQFRERIPAFFDLVVHLGIGKKGDHYIQPTADRFRASKSRYRLDPGKLDKDGRIENDWTKIKDAIVRAE